MWSIKAGVQSLKIGIQELETEIQSIINIEAGATSFNICT